MTRILTWWPAGRRLLIRGLMLLVVLGTVAGGVVPAAPVGAQESSIPQCGTFSVSWGQTASCWTQSGQFNQKINVNDPNCPDGTTVTFDPGDGSAPITVPSPRAAAL